jgi:hypothetical protein
LIEIWKEILGMLSASLLGARSVGVTPWSIWNARENETGES